MSSTSLYYGNSPARESEPKPKKMTKREQVVMDLREKLQDITEGQKMWMMSVPFADEHVAYYWKRGQVWCQECGHVEPKAALESELIINLGVQKYVCPHCGKTLTLKPYNYGWKGWRKVVKDCR